MTVARDINSFRLPADEDDLVALVKLAYTRGLELRVRGAAHSPAHAIYTDPLEGVENVVGRQTPPDGRNINVLLDRYTGWRVKSEELKLIEADAGIHLGADPSNPTGPVPCGDSLLSQLWDKGWTLSDLGGITHQTVSGFTATGSAGGSVRYSANKDVQAVRLIDGTGEIYEVSIDDDPDMFCAVVPNLGLLGVVSKITFRCVDRFNISGTVATTKPGDCAIDLFGGGDPTRKSLERFLTDTDYARVEWWPQRNGERAVVWQATKIADQPGFVRNPYRQFGRGDVTLSQIAVSILFTILGNLDDVPPARRTLDGALRDLTELPAAALATVTSLGPLGDALGRFLATVADAGLDLAIATLIGPLARLIAATLPSFYPVLLDRFLPYDTPVTPAGGGPTPFQDHSWLGLPMDNEVDDQLMPTEFTELWVPLGRTQQVMEALRCHFDEPPDDRDAYRRTGTFAFELYAEMPNRFWLNPAYTDGTDEWRKGAFRLDVYWFARNAGDPAKTFFRDFWNLLRCRGIPVRLHWGKFLPDPETDPDWVGFVRSEYPKWDAFMGERTRRDPNDVFLNEYWRDHLGLPPQAKPPPA